MVCEPRGIDKEGRNCNPMGAYQNFGGLPKKYTNYEDSHFVILPVPYEKTTTYIRGTEHAPKAIIDASANVELYDEELENLPYKHGIATLSPVLLSRTLGEAVEQIKKRVGAILKHGKFPVLIGGEHTISLGFFLALREKFGRISVLQLDAHSDLRDEYEGKKLSHACVMRRIREYDVDVVQVGIRSLDHQEAVLIGKNKWKIFFAKDIRDSDISEEIVQSLEEKNVFVTVDADVFDPSLIRSVGTPEPGGLGWYQALSIMKEVAQKRNIVGFDFVELCPSAHDKASDFVSAKFIYKTIGYIGAFQDG